MRRVGLLAPPGRVGGVRHAAHGKRPVQVYSAFPMVELRQDASAIAFVIEMIEQVQRLGDPSNFRNCSGQEGWPFASL